MELQEVLEFRPKIWWDPVPDWVFSHLDRESTFELARVSLDVHREMLEVQLRSLDRIAEVLNRQKG
jgi:hypothetical protein